MTGIGPVIEQRFLPATEILSAAKNDRCTDSGLQRPVEPSWQLNLTFSQRPITICLSEMYFHELEGRFYAIVRVLLLGLQIKI